MHKLHPIRESFEKRFWKHVRKTETCWLWPIGKGKTYRPRMRRGRASEGSELVSRASWRIHFGDIPDGLFVCHKCDVWNCVRPSHLFLGTQADNLRDMAKKRRHWLQGHGHLVAADKNSHSKLSWKQVRQIRYASTIGSSGSSLAKKFGVHRNNIYEIIHGRTWVERGETSIAEALAAKSAVA